MTLPQGSTVKSMDFHPLQQILLLGKQPQYIEQLFPSFPVCMCARAYCLQIRQIFWRLSFLASLFQLEQAWVMSWYGSWAAEKGLVGRISRFGTIMHAQGLRRYILTILMEYEVIMILSGAVISG